MSGVIYKKRDAEPYEGWPGNLLYYASTSQGSSASAQYWVENLSSIHTSGASSAGTLVTGSQTVFTDGEQIEYINGKPDSWNPCHHRRQRALNVPYTLVYQRYYRPSDYYLLKFARVNTQGSPTGPIGKHLTDNYQAARSRAWWTMQPRFEGTISMLNFLYELKDVKNLLLQAQTAYRRIRSFAPSSIWRKRPSPLQSSADAVLTWNLGIAPMLSDFANIWEQLGQKVLVAQEIFKQKGEDPNTRYYSEILEDQSSLVVGRTNSYYSSTGISLTTKFTAAMQFRYGYELRSPTAAFMRYWGLEGSYETIWNAIPFSFILDYYVQIGKAIHAMETDDNVELELMHYSESLKTVKSSGFHVYDRSQGDIGALILDGALSSGGLAAGYESTLYNRFVRKPTKGLYVPIVVKKRSDRQNLNLLSLAISAFS